MRKSTLGRNISSGWRGLLMEWNGGQEGCPPTLIPGWAQGATTETTIMMTGRGMPSPTTWIMTMRLARDSPWPMGDPLAREPGASPGHALHTDATDAVQVLASVAASAVKAAPDHLHVGTTSIPRHRSLLSLVRLIWGAGYCSRTRRIMVGQWLYPMDLGCWWRMKYLLLSILL